MPVSKVMPTVPAVELYVFLTQPFLAAGLTHFSVPSHALGDPKQTECTLPQPLPDFRDRFDCPLDRGGIDCCSGALLHSSHTIYQKLLNYTQSVKQIRGRGKQIWKNEYYQHTFFFHLEVLKIGFCCFFVWLLF